MSLPNFLRVKSYLAVVVVALVARLFALWMAVAHHGATWLYTRGLEVGFVADSLLTGRGFSSPFGGATGPTALIAPGYPLLVAGVFKVFGTYSVSSALTVMFAQLCVNLATNVLIMRLAERFAGRRAALIAGAFWAIWPPLLWMPTIFWETSLSTFMLLGMIMFALHVSEKPNARLWLAFGVLCGLAVLINMALLLSLACIFVWLALYTYRDGKKPILLATLLPLLIFAPWPIRNAHAFHTFIPLRTTVGLELWMGNHDGASGYVEEALFPIYNKAELQEYERVGEVAYDHEKSSIAHAWIVSHPATFVKLSLVRFWRFWSGSGSRGGSPIFVLGALMTTVCGLWGLSRLYQSGNRSTALLLSIPMVAFPLPYYITHAEFRYRLVLDPLLTVLSAYALASRFAERDMSEAASFKPIDLVKEELVA